jgi:hypothetical protein
MSQTKYVIILLFLAQAIISQGQTSKKGDCKEIDVTIETVKSPITNKSSVLKVTFHEKGYEKGDFIVRLITTQGVVTELKKLEVTDLAPGKYAVVINGRNRQQGFRCPSHKEVTIEGQ